MNSEVKLLYSQEEINQLHDDDLSDDFEVVRDRCIIGYYHLLNPKEMIHADMDEFFVQNGHTLRISDPNCPKRARRIPLHPITRPIFEKYNFKIPKLGYFRFRSYFSSITRFAGIKGKAYGYGAEKILPGSQEWDRLIIPQALYNSAASNLLEQTNDVRLLWTLRCINAPRGLHMYPYSFDSIKENYFSEPIRGWKALTSILPIP